jgi:hypothetical protein
MLIGEGLVAELSMINSGGFVGLKRITNYLDKEDCFNKEIFYNKKLF